MKNFFLTLATIITFFNLPGIIQLFSKTFYDKNTSAVWWIPIGLSVAAAITELPFKNTRIRKAFRTIRFYVFRTINVTVFMTVQLILLLFLSVYNSTDSSYKLMILAIVIDAIVINLLIISGKIPNNDSKRIILHIPANGKIYLQINNRLRYVPDPATFNLLGLSWSELIDIKAEDLDSYHKDAPITSIKDMRLIDYRGSVYGIVNDILKHVPNEGTLAYIQQHRTNKTIDKVDEIDAYTKDTPFASVS
jgi:hypothetical protein